MPITIPVYDLSIFKGFTCSVNFTYTEDDETTPVPFSDTDGLVFILSIGINYNLRFLDSEVSPKGSKIQIIDRDAATFRLNLTDEETNLMKITDKGNVGSYAIGLVRQTNDSDDINGRIDPILKGEVSVTKVA